MSRVLPSDVLSLKIWPFHPLFTNCFLLIHWNERVTVSATVLEWDCHMLKPSQPLRPHFIISLCNFSDGHAGHLDTGLRLRNPAIPCPIFVSDWSPSFISKPMDYHFASCRNFSTTYFRWGETTGLPLGGTDTQRKQQRFASVKDCTDHLVLPVSLL